MNYKQTTSIKQLLAIHVNAIQQIDDFFLSQIEDPCKPNLPKEIFEKISSYVDELCLDEDSKDYFYELLAELYCNRRVICTNRKIPLTVSKETLKRVMCDIYFALKTDRHLSAWLIQTLFQEELKNQNHLTIYSSFK